MTILTSIPQKRFFFLQPMKGVRNGECKLENSLYMYKSIITCYGAFLDGEDSLV